MQPFDFTELFRTLQTAISPVALISGVGLLLLSMTNRLGRTTDRARALSEVIDRQRATNIDTQAVQIRILFRRSQILRLAITLALTSILLVSLLVIAMFAISTLHLNLHHLVIILFVISLLALVGSLVLFIQDIALTLKALRLEIKEHL